VDLRRLITASFNSLAVRLSAFDPRHTEDLSTTLRRMYFVCEDCGYRTPAGFEILF